MPTPLPPTEKANFISLVRVAPYPGGPNEADRLQTILNTYDDVITAIFRQLELFATNNAYLTNCLNVLNQVNVEAAGIWFNTSISSPPLTDPILIVNSTITEVILNPASPPAFKQLCILGSSYIGKVYLEPGATLNDMYIGPGAVVDIHDSSAFSGSPPAYAITQRIDLPFLKNTPATLNAIAYQSVVNQVYVEPGSNFGGVQTDDPNLPCTQQVTGITATEITKDSVLVSWTKPASYLFIDVYYKKTRSNVWVKVDDSSGSWQPNDSGFAFSCLESDTFYDVKITSRCLNGGLASNTVTFQTVCCGSGSMLSLYKNCQIKMLISSTPDSPPNGQVLCNGVSIDLHYPPGTTITIPYLATVNCAMISDIVVDNDVYQLVPFNKATGTWDFSSTSIGGVNEGSVVTVGMSLPA